MHIMWSFRVLNVFIYFCSFNNLYGKLGNSCSVESIVHLMKVNCLTAMLYNLESVVLNKSDLNKLEFSLGRAFVKIFRIRDRNSLNWCKYYMNQLPIQMLLDLKRIMYLQKIANYSDCFIYVTCSAKYCMLRCSSYAASIQLMLPRKLILSMYASRWWKFCLLSWAHKHVNLFFKRYIYLSSEWLVDGHNYLIYLIYCSLLFSWQLSNRLVE